MADDKGFLKTGTTTVGLVGKDCVVLASDRRATMGYLIASKDIDKIYPIDDHIAMTVAGSVGDAQKLVRWMEAEARNYALEKERPISVNGAAVLLANILSSYKVLPFWVQLLVGGVDETGPHLFSVDMLGGVTEEIFTSTGSGSPIAYGVLETNFKKGMSCKDLTKIAAKAVWAAMQRDAASGEHIDVVIVDRKGFKRMPRQDVKKLI